MLHERRAAGDAGVEPAQHDLRDRQQRQQREGEHGEAVLEDAEASAVVDAASFRGGVGIVRGGHFVPRVLRNASRSRVAWS